MGLGSCWPASVVGVSWISRCIGLGFLGTLGRLTHPWTAGLGWSGGARSSLHRHLWSEADLLPESRPQLFKPRRKSFCFSAGMLALQMARELSFCPNSVRSLLLCKSLSRVPEGPEPIAASPCSGPGWLSMALRKLQTLKLCIPDMLQHAHSYGSCATLRNHHTLNIPQIPCSFPIVNASELVRLGNI